MNPIEYLMKTQLDLTGSPEWHRIQEVRHFSQSVDLFNRNYNEALQLIDYVTIENPGHFGNLKNEPERQELFTELSRRIHNLISMAFTLVDHQRRIFEKKYQNSTEFSDYAEIHGKFLTEPVSCFIKDFRNYISHRALPEFVHQTSFTQTHGLRFFFALKKKQLLEGYEWKSIPRKFIESSEDLIDIRPILINYHQLVMDFYKWFFSKLTLFHKADLAEIERKQRQYNQALAQAAPGLILANMSDDVLLQGPEDIFVGIINPLTIREFTVNFSDPLERMEKLLDHLQPDFQFSVTFREKLVNYARRYKPS